MEVAGIEPANNASQEHKQHLLTPIFSVWRLSNYTIKPHRITNKTPNTEETSSFKSVSYLCLDISLLKL